MRPLAILTVVLVVSAGCNKKPKDVPADTAPPPPVQSGGNSGGSVGSVGRKGDLTFQAGGVQSARVAAARIANQVEMKELHTTIYTSWSESMRMPTKDDITKEAGQNKQVAALLKDEVIILTGTNNADAVWAYSQYPQRAGEHYVVTKQGIEQIAPEDLKKRLEQEMAPIKMSK